MGTLFNPHGKIMVKSTAGATSANEVSDRQITVKNSAGASVKVKSALVKDSSTVLKQVYPSLDVWSVGTVQGVENATQDTDADGNEFAYIRGYFRDSSGASRSIPAGWKGSFYIGFGLPYNPGLTEPLSLNTTSVDDTTPRRFISVKIVGGDASALMAILRIAMTSGTNTTAVVSAADGTVTAIGGEIAFYNGVQNDSPGIGVGGIHMFQPYTRSLISTIMTPSVPTGVSFVANSSVVFNNVAYTVSKFYLDGTQTLAFGNIYLNFRSQTGGNSNLYFSWGYGGGTYPGQSYPVRLILQEGDVP